jgi:hypothetical protein
MDGACSNIGDARRDVSMKFSEWFYCATYGEPHYLIGVKTRLYTFQLALATISTQ